MPRNRDKHTPPIKRKCPTDDEGNEMCSFRYEAINARETGGDWLAQTCSTCSRLTFIDKKKLAHGASS